MLINCFSLLFLSAGCEEHNQKQILPEWEVTLPTGSSPSVFYDGIPNLPTYNDIIVAHTTIFDGGFRNEDNRLCAIDIVKKEVVWYYPHNISDRSYYFFNSKGYTYGDKLVFQCQKDIRDSESSQYHSTVCLDIKTGITVCEHEGKSGYNSGINKPVAGIGPKCYFVMDSCTIGLINMENNTFSTFYDTDSLQINDLYANDEYLLASCSIRASHFNYNTYALVIQRSTGSKVLLSKINTGQILPHCIINNGVIFCLAGTYIAAIDIKSGRTIWERDDPFSDYTQDTYVYNNTLVKCGGDATTGYQTTDGEISYSLKSYGSWYASAHGPYLYVVNRQQDLDIISIETGSIISQIQCKYHDDGELFFGSYPTVFGEYIYIMSNRHLFRYPTYPW